MNDMLEQNTPPQEHDKDKEHPEPLTLGQVILSALAAMFGVQSEKKLERDFQSGDPASFIMVGIVLVILFILSLIFVVNTVLESAGH